MSDHFDRDGYLLKRAGSTKKNASTQKKWTAYYFNLIGGSLFYYKNPEDPEPKATIQLSEVKLEPGDTPTQFRLRGEKRDLLLSTDDEEDCKGWIAAIEANIGKEPAPPLKKEKRKSRAQILANKAKKNVAGKVAATKLGKKAIRAQAPEEITGLVLALKNIVERVSNSKKANEIEEAIYKIGIKCFFLVENGTVPIQKFLLADKPLREALTLLGKCHDHAKYSRNLNEKLLLEKLGEVQKHAGEAAQLLGELLEPHIKPKNLTMMKETDPSAEDDLSELIGASEHYTQFHFYADEH